MGKKFTINKKKLKQRKKRGSYRDTGEKTAEELDKVFPGYEKLKSISRGVVEGDDDQDIDPLECDDCLIKDDIKETFKPPATWGVMMSKDKKIQRLFENKFRVNEEEKDPVEDIKGITKDMIKTLGGTNAEIGMEVYDRLMKIQDRAPEFIGLLAYMIEPITRSTGGLGEPVACWPSSRDAFAEYELDDS